MRRNLFTRNLTSETSPEQVSASPQASVTSGTAPQPRNGRTFPADEVVWGIVIRSGFDEIDDPWYHRGVTQHAYLEGNDSVALCGFRPPQSGSRTRRRARLGLPTTGQHPMCGSCARMVVAPRPRVPVPVQPGRQVPMPVARAGSQALPLPIGPGAPQATPPAAPVSPWILRAAGNAPAPDPGLRPDSHDAGLMARGVHTDGED
jgi:hypothetical protein